jgi:hypothetical protein
MEPASSVAGLFGQRWTVLTLRACSYGLFKASDKRLLESDNVGERLSTIDKIVQEYELTRSESKLSRANNKNQSQVQGVRQVR